MNLGFELPDEFLGLAAALAIGLLIGLERGWQGRALPQGGRAAGLRTFAITGLLGGILASLPEDIAVWSISMGLFSIGLFMAIAYWRGWAAGNQSMTTAVSLLLTFALGAFAVVGNTLLALGMAVIVAMLLNLKETLHGWLRKIQAVELRAGIQLLVLSIVILPNLPDTNLGPYNALNPYQLWWAVILIAGLSMAGHIAMRAVGASRGVMWTGLLGGLASSTATTLALSRLVQQNPGLMRSIIAGALAATGMMTLRLMLIVWVLQITLFMAVAPFMAGAACVLFAPFVWGYRHAQPVSEATDIPKNIRPYSLQTAIVFALFLAGIGIMIPLVKDWLGSEGVYVVAAVSGLADVDAITISLGHLFSTQELSLLTACIGILLAVVVNLFVKLAITYVAGSKQLALGVGLGYLGALAVSGALFVFLPL